MQLAQFAQSLLALLFLALTKPQQQADPQQASQEVSTHCRSHSQQGACRLRPEFEKAEGNSAGPMTSFVSLRHVTPTDFVALVCLLCALRPY